MGVQTLHTLASFCQTGIAVIDLLEEITYLIPTTHSIMDQSIITKLSLDLIGSVLLQINLYLRIAQSIIAILCNSRRKITKSTTTEPME